MANVDWASGLRPIGNGKGGTAPRITKYTRSTTTAVIYEGALLVDPGDPNMGANAAALDSRVVGVAAHYVAIGDADVYVYDDPDQEFLIQGDSADAVADPGAAVGQFGPPVSTNSGSSTTLQSSCELDVSELEDSDATAGDMLQIRRLWNADDNDQDAIHAKWVVKIAHRAHTFGGDTAGS